MPSFGGNLIPFSEYRDARKWRETLQQLHELASGRVQVPLAAYNTVVSSFGNRDKWYIGTMLLEAIPRMMLERSVVSHNALLRALNVQNRWLSGCQVLVAMFVTNVEPDIITCNTAISICDGLEQWPRALPLLGSCERCSLEVADLAWLRARR